MKQPFKGLHRVRKRLASGTSKTYYYAWRGGPRLNAEFGTPAFHTEFVEAHKQQHPASKDTFDVAISEYLQSQNFLRLAPRTRTGYRALIEIIRAKFGAAKLSYFNEARTRQVVYKWRDTFSDHARKADYLISVLSAILSFQVDRSRLDRNIVSGMSKLYKCDRSSVIWTDEEIDRVCAVASPQLAWTIRFEALTGLRTADLIEIPWNAVQSKCIDWRTSKNKVDVFLPLTQDMRALLNEMPNVGPTIVTNTKGNPWTDSGLKTMFGRAKDASGVKGKHFHDLRGTAATKLCLVGLNDTEIAAIIGWQPNRVAEIRARYVDRDIIVQGAINQIEKNEIASRTVNQGVNRTPMNKENTP